MVDARTRALNRADSKQSFGTASPSGAFDIAQFVIAVGNLIEKPRHLGEDSIRLVRMVNLMAG
jgi:hypothetical protein